jgi:serine/threonine-protein kinase
MPGAVVGTATYLSPEQAMGEALDHRSDLYSLGMVLYEMLAGRAPFSGGTPVAVAYKQVNEVPPPPSVYNPDVPPSLDSIVLRALAKNPAERQQSAEALRAELLDVRFGAVEPEPTLAAAGAAGGALAAPVLADATATAVAAGPATAMMPPPTGVDLGRPVAPPPRRLAPAPAPYRRRQLTVVVVLLLAAVAAIALLSALGGGDKKAEPVTVPSVVGFDVNDAVAEINRVGLNPHTETKTDAEGAIDTIIEQNPIGGARAKKGDTVKLFLPAGSSETSITTTPTTAPTTTAAPATEPATTVAPTTQATAPATTVATIPPTTAPPVTAPPTTATVTTVVVSVPAGPAQSASGKPPKAGGNGGE